MNNKSIFLIIIICIFFLMGCNNTSSKESGEELTDNIVNNENIEIIEEATQVIDDPTQTTTGESSDEEATHTVDENDEILEKCSYKEQYEIWDITSEVFSDETLIELGAFGFTGTDAEIAQQIYDWQAANMDYASPTDSYQDVGFGSRWNNMLPGIYPASERINHVSPDGKIYGICGDFASIYIAIANAYDLEVRETIFPLERHEELFNSLPAEVLDERTFRGLGREEFELLNIILQKNGIELSYEQVHRAIQGRSTIAGQIQGLHSRAEVFLDGKWVAFDGTRAFLDLALDDAYDNDENYVPANWDGIYNPIRLYAPAFQEFMVPDAPIDFDGLIDYLSCGPQVIFTGITDDLGNENRAEIIEDFISGDALLPYFLDLQKNADFLNMDVSYFEEDEYEDAMDVFLDGTGRHLNVLADFLLYGDDEVDPNEYVRLYNSITGDTLTVEEFNEYIE